MSTLLYSSIRGVLSHLERAAEQGIVFLVFRLKHGINFTL